MREQGDFQSPQEHNQNQGFSQGPLEQHLDLKNQQFNEQLFPEEAPTDEGREFANYFLGRFSTHIRDSGRDVLDVSRAELRDFFHDERIHMNEEWGDNAFINFTMPQALGATKRTIAWLEDLKHIDKDEASGALETWDDQINWYAGLQDLFEKVLHRTPEEEQIVENIRKDLRVRVLYPEPVHGDQTTQMAHLAGYLGSPKYALLPEDAPGDWQRSLAFMCASAMFEKVQQNRTTLAHLSNNPPEPFVPLDMYLFHQWYKEGEEVDFSLGHVLAATKRQLLYYHAVRDTNEAMQDHYADTFTLYHLLAEAVATDATPTSSTASAISTPPLTPPASDI